MPEIRISGAPPSSRIPADLTGMSIDQLRGLDTGAVTGATSQNDSGPINSWMITHASQSSGNGSARRARSSANTTGGGGGAGAPGASIGSDAIAAGFVRAIMTPIPGAPPTSLGGALESMAASSGGGGRGGYIGSSPSSAGFYPGSAFTGGCLELGEELIIF